MGRSATYLDILNYGIERKHMIDRAIVLVEGATLRGDLFMIDAATEDLLDQYPACGMTFAELRSEVAIFAVRGGGAVQFG